MNRKLFALLISFACINQLPVLGQAGDSFMGETYNKLWNTEVHAKIDQDIEKYRKGDAMLEITDQNGNPLVEAEIKIKQQTHEFLFGSNLFVLGQLKTPELNAKYEKLFADLFNFATLPFYWAGLEPQEGKPRFEEGSSFIWRRPPPDHLLNWCKVNNIIAKGHALMYNRNIFMPEWTKQDNPEIFLKQSRKHIKQIAKRYKDEIAVWDVVNEERYRTRNPETGNKVPDNYLPWCFHEAGRFFPKDVKLIYNDDTQCHEIPDEYAGYINTVIENGCRIEGMGVQFHLFNLESRNKYLEGNLYPPEQLINFYNRMSEFDLPIYITEITIPGSGDNGDIIQAEIVKDLYRFWFSIPNMAGITWWNLGDGTAYKSENKTNAGLLDEEMNPKPAYKVLDELINKEWQTNEVLKTDTQGQIQFRGFYGKYKIEVKYQGEKIEKEINLSKSGNSHYMIELK